MHHPRLGKVHLIKKPPQAALLLMQAAEQPVSGPFFSASNQFISSIVIKLPEWHDNSPTGHEIRLTINCIVDCLHVNTVQSFSFLLSCDDVMSHPRNPSTARFDRCTQIFSIVCVLTIFKSNVDLIVGDVLLNIVQNLQAYLCRI